VVGLYSFFLHRHLQQDLSGSIAILGFNNSYNFFSIKQVVICYAIVTKMVILLFLLVVDCRHYDAGIFLF